MSCAILLWDWSFDLMLSPSFKAASRQKITPMVTLSMAKALIYMSKVSML